MSPLPLQECKKVTKFMPPFPFQESMKKYQKLKKTHAPFPPSRVKKGNNFFSNNKKLKKKKKPTTPSLSIRTLRK